MSRFQMVKCPYCGQEFRFNLDRAAEVQKPVTLRFMGTSQKIGPRPTHITATCTNPHCGRGFYIK